MAGLELTEPPLAKLHRIFPVSPSNAYIVPVASKAPAKTTPFAALTGPVARAIASDGVVAVGLAGGSLPATCQRTFPVVQRKCQPFESVPRWKLGVYGDFPGARSCLFFKEAEQQREHTKRKAHKKDGLRNDGGPLKYPRETKNRGDQRDHQP